MNEEKRLTTRVSEIESSLVHLKFLTYRYFTRCKSNHNKNDSFIEKIKSEIAIGSENVIMEAGSGNSLKTIFGDKLYSELRCVVGANMHLYTNSVINADCSTKMQLKQVKSCSEGLKKYKDFCAVENIDSSNYNHQLDKWYGCIIKQLNDFSNEENLQYVYISSPYDKS